MQTNKNAEVILFKILLVYLQPKDIKEVLEPLKEIPCDKLYLKYTPYPVVYQLAYDFIRDHPEYTHIFWLQNDIILNKQVFAAICYEFASLPDIDILGVSMNVDLGENRNRCAFTTAPISRKNLKIDWPIRGFFEGIIKVYHNGGPFLIKRPLYMIFPLRGEERTGINADVLHGEALWNEKIPYYLDTRIHLKHLRYQGEMMIHKKESALEFVRWTL